MRLTVDKIREEIKPILKRHNVKKAAVFGSYARGDQKEKSDIDILIEYEKETDKSLLDFVALKLELEKKLKRKVDLVEYCAIRPRIKTRVLSEQLAIL